MFSLIKNGFTLFELIISIAVLAIITAIALPHFQQLMAEQEVKSTLSKLALANRSAKNLALVHRANIVICPSKTLTQCEPANWNSGFIVFIDINKNRLVDSAEKVLQTEVLNLKYGSLDWKGTLSIPSLTFQALSGLPIGSNGGFYYCSLMGQPHQKLNLSKMGHTRIENISAC